MAVPMHLVRLAVLITVTLFGLITLGLGAALTNTTETKFIAGFYFTYSALAIASGVLTILTVPAMIALEMVKPGGPTSWIAVEIPWLGLLSILYLATGAEAAEATQGFDILGFGTGCGGDPSEFDDGILSSMCADTRAIAAFGFLNWIILMFYVLSLIVFSTMAVSRKETGVWTSSVQNAPFHGGSTGKTGTVPQSYAGTSYPDMQHSNTGGTVQAGTVHV